MKKLLLILLISLASKTEAQRNLFIKDLFGSTDSTIKRVPLPPISETDVYVRFVRMGDKKTERMGLPISDLETYYKFFSDKKPDSLPQIDFDRHEIYLRWYCAQCLTVCHHAAAHNGNTCHRNRCNLTGIWVMRDKVGCAEPAVAKKED